MATTYPPILGAIIAGGRSVRFGSDKALALIDGQPLIAHVAQALARQCAAVVVCGRDWDGLTRLDDRPSDGLGPLGGLNAALTHAAAHGFDGVLCCPVDVHPVPPDCADRLAGEGARVFADQHMLGYWPAALAAALDAFVAQGGRAMHRWIIAAGAQRVPEPPGMININRREDLRPTPPSG